MAAFLVDKEMERIDANVLKGAEMNKVSVQN